MNHVVTQDGPVVRMVAVTFQDDGTPVEQVGTETMAVPVACRACGWDHTAVAYRPTGEGVQAAINRTAALHHDYLARRRGEGRTCH